MLTLRHEKLIWRSAESGAGVSPPCRVFPHLGYKARYSRLSSVFSVFSDSRDFPQGHPHWIIMPGMACTHRIWGSVLLTCCEWGSAKASDPCFSRSGVQPSCAVTYTMVGQNLTTIPSLSPLPLSSLFGELLSCQ
jgi:hypothetical protein